MLRMNSEKLTDIDEDSFLLAESPQLTMDSIEEEDKDLLKSPQAVQLSTQPSWDDYNIVQTLGEGAYGKVFKVSKKLHDLLHQKLIDNSNKSSLGDSGSKSKMSYLSSFSQATKLLP